MKIGINASFFTAGKGGGIERAVRCLANSLGRVAVNHAFVLFSGRGNAGSFLLADNFFERLLPVNPQNRVSKVFFEQAVLPVCIARERLDALISPGNMAALFAPCPQVIIVHDCVPWNKSAQYGAFHGLALKALFLFSTKVAAKIITPSMFSKSEALRYLGPRPETIIVAPLSGEHIPFRPGSEKISGGFILCVSSESAHKNADGLLAAYNLARNDFGVKIPLVMVGVAERPGNPGVVFRKAVSENSLHALYEGATLAVAPSFYEGFGLAAAEAMQAGVPLAASRIPAHIETTGGAAFFFDPRDTVDTARALSALSENAALQKHLSEAGLKRAAELGWDDFAQKVMAAVESCTSKAPDKNKINRKHSK